MSDEEDALEKWSKEHGIPDEEMQRMFSPELRMLHLFERLSERVEVTDQESRQRDEEHERKISFILEQQAQFTADMQQLREAQARAEERWDRAEEKWDRMWERTNSQINSLLAVAQIQSHQIDGLAEAQAKTDRQMAETNGKLNALINVVEQFISEKRNGG